MFRNEAGWVISPTDLVDAMECDHRSALKTALAAKLPGAPAPADIDPLVAQHGHEHERAELDRLRALFGEDGVAAIDDPHPTHTDMLRAAQATTRAMADGTPVIYQGVFYHRLADGIAFHGRADFLISTAVDPATGRPVPGADPRRYEPHDTKLARRPGPSAVLQLAAYARALTDTGAPAPEHMHLITGDGTTHTHRAAEFTPLLHTLTRRLTTRLTTPQGRPLDTGDLHLPAPLWGEPRPACDGCGYAALCTEGRTAARHLSLVAGIRTDQARKLADAGLTTIDALAAAGDDDRPATLPRHSYDRLRSQAALQVRQDATRTDADPQGSVIAEVHSPDGLASLPAPSPGDVFFDMEGYPYHGGSGERGLEYLFGAVAADEAGAERFHAFWAHDRTQEKQAFEAFIDFATERIDRDPGAHIYHYASYEADRLKLLAAEFGTRETEVDDLLRHRRLVDLYTVVKKSLRVSQRSYSIKYLEPLYLDAGRTGGVTTAASSIDAYAEHLAAAAEGDRLRAAKILDEIADYNRDDCDSTARLRDWLEELRADHGITARPAHQGETAPEDADERAAERRRAREEAEARLRALTGPLLDGIAPDPADRTPAQAARALLASLAGYYRREENPSWWDFFRRLSAPLEELETDNDCLVPVRVRTGDWQEPTGRQRKARREVELRADPARPHPFTTGDKIRLLYPGPPGQPSDAVDAEVTAATADTLTLTETSDPADTYARAPAAALPGAPVRSTPKDAALWSLTESALPDLPSLPTGPGLDLLRRARPRLAGGAPLPDPADHPGADGAPDTVAAAIRAVHLLDGSYLAVQGPPGAGKTYLAARLICDLAERGHTIGVCSTSHKAVENVLRAALAAARRNGTDLPCAKRPSGRKADPDAPWEQPSSVKALAAWRTSTGAGHLVGGTAWNFANEALAADPFDVLIIDEAGQFSLADTLATSTAARNLVLLGDPQQLPQVVQGSHGEGAAASALEHLVGDAEIIDPALGYFLDRTRRMHPAVCAPVSELSYRGMLHAHPSAAQRRIDGVPAGLYARPVAHQGRTTHSPEEVEQVVAIAAHLIGRTVTEPGATASRELTAEDVLVVAPYNMQVRALRRALSQAGLDGVRVGTVDRFQGQEAPAVICSMTASSSADLTRGLDFVLSRNRLNVALSRAQLVAALVYSPDLLAATPRSIGDLRVLAGFAGLCDRAEPWPPTA